VIMMGGVSTPRLPRRHWITLLLASPMDRLPASIVGPLPMKDGLAWGWTARILAGDILLVRQPYRAMRARGGRLAWYNPWHRGKTSPSQNDRHSDRMRPSTITYIPPSGRLSRCLRMAIIPPQSLQAPWTLGYQDRIRFEVVLILFRFTVV
jgi:hypothetical protein